MFQSAKDGWDYAAKVQKGGWVRRGALSACWMMASYPVRDSWKERLAESQSNPSFHQIEDANRRYDTTVTAIWSGRIFEAKLMAGKAGHVISKLLL